RGYCGHWCSLPGDCTPATLPLHPSSTLPYFFFQSARAHLDLHSFPTRRSSDLASVNFVTSSRTRDDAAPCPPCTARNAFAMAKADRKSTRLNSSHVSISYAVFCLKKKKEIIL